MISRTLNAWRDRPEPFKPYDYDRRRTRWARWMFAGIAAAGTVALVAVVSDSGPPAASSSLAADGSDGAPRAVAAATGSALELLPVMQELQPQSPPAAVPDPRQPTEPPARTERQVVTTAPSGANMRGTPSLAGAVLWKAPIGTPLRVIEEEGNWLRVATPTGARAGWMHRSVVGE
jgi:hypothetical protein